MKSTIYKSLLSGVLLAVFAAGCTTEDFSSPSDDKDAVIISAGVNLSESGTRAADAAWAANDHIGITMLSTSGGVNFYTNRDYVTTGGDGTFVSNPENNKMYYPIDGSDVTFKAYYPYTGLGAYPTYPVNVSGQADIAGLDLMTAVHENTDASTANNKNKPNAHLVFHHRLTMITVNLLTEAGSPIDLTGSELVIKGMKTTGSYDLMSDILTVDAGSVQDIIIPLSSEHTGRAILLPREAAEGVIFEVTTANGGVYTAAMDKDLELKGGSKYTFNLTLKTTPALITASIEDWTEGPTRSYDVVHVVTAQGENEGFEEDDELRLYVKDDGDGDYSYSKGGTFIFDGAKWGIVDPIYWESFTGPVDFRATSVYAEKLNSTQMDDYVVGETTGVALYNGVHLEMKHVGTKVTVKLSSGDGTYSAADLNAATVTLPQYFNTGSLDAVTGAYAIGTGKGDITPEKQGTASPADRVAIFPHQTIAAGTTLVKVVINGHVYEVKDNTAFAFEQGKHHEITLNIEKSGVLITAEVMDWVEGEDYATEVRIGTPSLGENENILNGSVLKLFTEETTGAERSEVPGYFTYNSTTDKWNYSDSANPLFWENLPNTGRFFASMEYNAVNSTHSYNQSKDYIVATPVDNNGGVGNTALHFEMSHAVSQVRVVLRSSDTYTSAQLKTAEITLPGYTIGGSLNKGVYVPGTNTSDIRLDVPDNDQVLTRAYLQAQTIATGQTVARVKIGTRTYNVTYVNPVIYNPGEITTLYITIKGSELLVSVKITGWVEQTPVELSYSFNQSATSVTGFLANDEIRFYKVNPATNNVASGTDIKKDYVYNGTDLIAKEVGGVSIPWYRDDFANGDKIVAVFPSTASDVASGGNTFAWNMNSRNAPTRANDILVATDGVIVDRNANIDLTFNHVLSQVTVNIISGEGFALNEITGGNPSVQLVNFMQQGTVNISTGAVSGLSDSQSFAPTPLVTPNTGAVLSYQALVMPQTKGSDPVLVKVTLNGIVYDAQWTGTFNFEAGKHHVLNITLAKTGLKLSARIAEWMPGSNGSITIK
jgi:hypothetical protein